MFHCPEQRRKEEEGLSQSLLVYMDFLAVH